MGSTAPHKDRWFSEVNYSYRYPVCLYVTRAEDETRITDEFMENVASIAAEVRCPDASMSISCTDPQLDKTFIPDAAAVIYVDYKILSAGEHEAELICTITMKMATSSACAGVSSIPPPLSISSLPRTFLWTPSRNSRPRG